MTLPFGLTAEVLAAAAEEADPESVAAATRLRRHFPPYVAGAALGQVALRRRARSKFGEAADGMLFTRDGLEQATRPAVAAHHAARFLAAGCRTVVDLGCGIGADALAFVETGFRVVAVERDEQTYEVARYNLAGRAEVVRADVADVVADLTADPATAVYLDPARRTGAGRSWRVEDLSPGWDLVSSLLDRPGPVLIKLGPGFPLGLIPDGVEAEWVSHDDDLVELALWSGPGSEPGRRSALLLPGDRLVVDPELSAIAVGTVGAFLIEPLPAVNRSGARPVLAAALGAHALDDATPYLSAGTRTPTPYATSYAVVETFDFTPARLRAWAREHAVGTLEIKTRGLDLDPARLRRELKLRGPKAALVAITRTDQGKTVLVLER